MDVVRRVRELETLTAIGEILNREGSFEDAAEDVLHRLVDLTEVTTGWLFLATLEHGDPHHSRFRLGAMVGIPPALATRDQAPLRRGSCECMGLFRRAELDTGTNLVTCSRLEAAIGDTRGLVIHASVPLRGRRSPIGILNLASPGTEPFDRHTLDLLTAVGRQLGVAFERDRYYAQRQTEAQHVAVLEERNRVARDMHDSVTQLLFGAELSLRVARSEAEPERTRAAVDRAAGLVDSALRELRAVVELMRSADLDQGLAPALARLRMRTSGPVAVHVDAEDVRLPTAVAEGLYRVVQEALHNALKHADADNVWIRLAPLDHAIEVSVQDDGRGWPERLERGMGLESIGARVEELGGSLDLADRTDGGATVRVEVPWPSGS